MGSLDKNTKKTKGDVGKLFEKGKTWNEAKKREQWHKFLLGN